MIFNGGESESWWYLARGSAYATAASPRWAGTGAGAATEAALAARGRLCPAPRGRVCTGAAQTMDSVSTSPCGPSFRVSRRTVGFSPLPSPSGGADRPLCSSLASSDTSG